MKHDISIREANPKDHSSIVAFQLEMAIETEGFALDKDTVEKGVLRIFDEPFRGKYFVAETDKILCGSLLIVKEWSDWRNGDVWWIHSVYVPPEMRKAKVFSQMYEYIKAQVNKDENIKGLRLYVEKKNSIAQKAYERLGMKSDHYHMYEWMKNF